MSNNWVGDEFNNDWSPEAEQMMLNLLNAPRDQQPHTCGWVVGGEACSDVLFPREFSGHLREHGVTGDDNAKMSCCWVGCDADPMNRESMLRHVVEVHLELRIECPDCGQTFTRRTTLNNHRRREHL